MGPRAGPATAAASLSHTAWRRIQRTGRWCHGVETRSSQRAPGAQCSAAPRRGRHCDRPGEIECHPKQPPIRTTELVRHAPAWLDLDGQGVLRRGHATRSLAHCNRVGIHRKFLTAGAACTRAVATVAGQCIRVAVGMPMVVPEPRKPADGAAAMCAPGCRPHGRAPAMRAPAPRYRACIINVLPANRPGIADAGASNSTQPAKTCPQEAASAAGKRSAARPRGAQELRRGGAAAKRSDL